MKLEQDYVKKSATNITRSTKKGVMKSLILSFANNTYLNRLRMEQKQLEKEYLFSMTIS